MSAPTKKPDLPISNNPQRKQSIRGTDQERDLGYVSEDAAEIGTDESLPEPDRINVDHGVDSDGDNDDEINNDVTSPKYPDVEDEPVANDRIPLDPSE